MRAADKFNQIYHTDPVYHTFTPYRICPMGAHSDHQYGKITGLAIDKGIHIGAKFTGTADVLIDRYKNRSFIDRLLNRQPDDSDLQIDSKPKETYVLEAEKQDE